jgi:c-di-GMP phosphodiesterase
VADGLPRLPLLRARFCELIGLRVEMHRDTNELFLLGLLSVMDALLNMRMSDVLAEAPVDEEIKKALVGEPSRYRPIFEVVLDYESATWDQLAHSAAGWLA